MIFQNNRIFFLLILFYLFINSEDVIQKSEDEQVHDASEYQIDKQDVESKNDEINAQEPVKENKPEELSKNEEEANKEIDNQESQQPEQAEEPKVAEEIKPENVEEPVKVEPKKEEVNKPKNEPSQQIQPAKQPVIEPKEDMEKDIVNTLDTLSVEDEGNWLLKRVWWEQAEATFEKIINLNNQMLQPQMEYFNRKNEANKAVEEMFRKIGFQYGELHEMLNYFLESVSKEREAVGILSTEERDFLNLVNGKRQELENLQTDLNSLNELETKFNEVLNQLAAQINKCREYEKNAWNDFKEIGRILNDKKAKALFYQIEGYLKNVQSIFNYINVDLKKYFDGLLDKADKLATSILSKIEELNNQGFNIKEEYQKIKQIEEQREIEAALKKRKAEEGVKPKPKQGWLDSIIGWFKSFYK